MLKNLSIQNYAIIETLNIDFEQGFSVITGETGAGKSIILGAMALVLGQRADAKTIKEGTNKCVIEAVFEVSEYNLQTFFEENDLDYEAICTFRREILPNGKSRSFINDTPTTLTILKDLGELLIDIHSQHENLLLKDNSFQLNVLDMVAKNETERKYYRQTFNSFKMLEAELYELIEKNTKDTNNREYLQFQLDQLQKAALKEHEKEDLEDELKRLTHAEEIKTELEKITQFLSNDTQGVLPKLKEAQTSARKITAYFPDAENYNERLNSAYLDLKDLAADIEARQNDIEFDSQRTEFISERLDLIYSLEQKHRLSGIAALLDLQAKMEDELNRIDNADEKIAALKKQLDEVQELLHDAAKKLTQTRVSSQIIVTKKLIEQLQILNMPHIRFEISITDKADFSISGKDKIEFMFSANEKMPLQAIAQIASGGEISRVMLALKAIIATTKAMPTIIFDEIDTGISGETASKMAGIMQEMSHTMQVLCITHLPQIAAKGNTHYKVYKNQSTTNIRCLTSEERITEIAQMLSGASLSEAAVENAKSLLAQ